MNQPCHQDYWPRHLLRHELEQEFSGNSLMSGGAHFVRKVKGWIIYTSEIWSWCKYLWQKPEISLSMHTWQVSQSVRHRTYFLTSGSLCWREFDPKPERKVAISFAVSGETGEGWRVVTGQCLLMTHGGTWSPGHSQGVKLANSRSDCKDTPWPGTAALHQPGHDTYSCESNHPSYLIPTPGQFRHNNI